MVALMSGNPGDAKKVSETRGDRLRDVNGNPQDAKKVSETRGSRLWDGKINNLYGSCKKRGFVNEAISRTVRLRECPLGVLSLYVFSFLKSKA